MRGITISDRQANNNILAVNLAEILQLLGPQLALTEWEISDIECLGTDSDRLHQLADSQTRVSGETLLQIATNILQVIDGTFAGYLKDKSELSIIVRAVDSSAYDVESSDDAILTKLRQRFQNVEDLPEASQTKLPYTVLIFWSDEDNCYLVHLPEFPSQKYHTHGDSYEEAMQNAREVLELLVEEYRQEGKSLPKPINVEQTLQLA